MKRLKKSDWIDLGWRQLSSEGPEALKIDSLCAVAGRSKGSFYHHFSDFDAFLAELTEEWVTRQTTDLMARFDPDAPLAPQMDAMIEDVIAMDYRFELGIRELARRHAGLAARLADVDEMRLAFTAKIYRLRFGLDEVAAAQMAELEYAVLAGLILLDPEMSAARQKALYQAYDALLVAKYGEGRA